MSLIKRIVCLANSRKLNGRCIAGKEIADRTSALWVRPVSAREHEEVSEYERQYEDGSDPRLLDIFEVSLLRAQPKAYQQENWLLNPETYWVKTGRIGWHQLKRLADAEAPLWIDGDHTYNGRNDRIGLALATSLRDSLRLLRVERLSLAVFKPGEPFGNPKRRVQVRFRHAGQEYRLWATDPVYERQFLAQPDGEYELDESYLTISLGEPHNGACYKLVAAIIERSRTES